MLGHILLQEVKPLKFLTSKLSAYFSSVIKRPLDRLYLQWNNMVPFFSVKAPKPPRVKMGHSSPLTQRQWRHIFIFSTLCAAEARKGVYAWSPFNPVGAELRGGDAYVTALHWLS